RGVVGPEGKVGGGGEAIDSGEGRGLENGAVGVPGEFFRIGVPVDQVAVVAVFHQIGDAAGLGYHHGNPATERFGGGEEIAFFFAVAEEHVAALQPVAVVEGIEIERTKVETVGDPELFRERLDLG